MKYIGINHAYKNLLKAVRAEENSAITLKNGMKARSAPSRIACARCGFSHAEWQVDGQFVCDGCIEQSEIKGAA